MSTFNKLGARKEIGAIAYRLDEPGLDHTILRRIIRRHIENLSDTLPVEEFGKTLTILRDALTLERWGEIRTIVALLQESIPTTYGSAPAGTTFRVWSTGPLLTKRKGGVEVAGRSVPGLHIKPDQIVFVENI